MIYIKHQVLDPLHEVLFNIKSVLGKDLVQVLLKGLEAYCVAVLMLSIVLAMLLQAVIRQVNVIVLVFEGVVVTASPEIPFLVVIELVLVRGKGPHSDVKLAAFEQKRALNVLLDHPIRVELPR